MSRHITNEMRAGVKARAQQICEYCLTYEPFAFSKFQIDHINPRIDRWTDHFRLANAAIQPITDVGRVTEKILDFNSVDRLLERSMLWRAGQFPHPHAIVVRDAQKKVL